MMKASWHLTTRAKVKKGALLLQYYLDRMCMRCIICALLSLRVVRAQVFSCLHHSGTLRERERERCPGSEG